MVLDCVRDKRDGIVVFTHGSLVNQSVVQTSDVCVLFMLCYSYTRRYSGFPI